MATPMTAVTSHEESWSTLLDTEVSSWGTTDPAVAAVGRTGVLGSAGPVDLPRPWASVTKIVAALAVLDVVHEGLLGLDEPAGPTGSTVRHLLAHASGLAFDEPRVLAAPGTRRIYSNVGIDVVTELACERTSSEHAGVLLTDRVLAPLGMTATTLQGPPSHGAVGPVSDLALLALELLDPRVLRPGLVVDATTPAFPELAGVLPGFGRQSPNDWGLGVELRGHKSPHWTPAELSPRAFGHFGQSGAFLWVDPSRGLGLVAATDTAFGPWAAQAWPRTSTRVLTSAALLDRRSS